MIMTIFQNIALLLVFMGVAFVVILAILFIVFCIDEIIKDIVEDKEDGNGIDGASIEKNKGFEKMNRKEVKTFKTTTD